MEYRFADPLRIPSVDPQDLESVGIITYLFVADLDLQLVHVVDSLGKTHEEPFRVVGAEARRLGANAPLEQIGIGIMQWIHPDEFSICSTTGDPLPTELRSFLEQYFS